MKMYLPFGDWSDDGHGKCKYVLIEAPSMEGLRNAQIQIEEQYGKEFWHEFAGDYDDSTISEAIEKALIATGYPAERFAESMDDSTYDEYATLEDIFNSDYYESYVTLDLVIDAFIWLLNAYGAQIIKVDDYEKIPTICNWTCPGFRTVGYGCFW